MEPRVDPPEAEPFLIDPLNRTFVATGEGRPAPERRIDDFRLAAIVALVFCCFTTGYGWYLWARFERLADHGRLVAGHVALHDRSSYRGRTTRALHVTFAPPGQPARTFQEPVSVKQFFAYTDGQVVDVLYDPDEPAHAAVRPLFWEREILGPLYASIASVVLLFGILATMLYRAWVIAWDRRLRSACVVLDGSVVDAWQLRGPSFRLAYRFSPPGRPPITQRTTYLVDDRYGLPKPGTPVKVLYRDERTFRLL